MNEFKNKVILSFLSLSDNIGLARIAAASFAAQLNLTISEIEDIKVAISEAVSNSIIHGYDNREDGQVELHMYRDNTTLEFIIIDYGKGIEDIEKACQPNYSTSEGRMGLGFVFMQSFMDDLKIESTLGKGTEVRLFKRIYLTDSI